MYKIMSRRFPVKVNNEVARIGSAQGNVCGHTGLYYSFNINI
jgi:hypothetical protein